MRLKSQNVVRKMFLSSLEAFKENYSELRCLWSPVSLFWKVKFPLVVSTHCLCLRVSILKNYTLTSHVLFGFTFPAVLHRLTFTLIGTYQSLFTPHLLQQHDHEEGGSVYVKNSCAGCWEWAEMRDLICLFSAKEFLTYKSILLPANKILFL